MAIWLSRRRAMVVSILAFLFGLSAPALAQKDDVIKAGGEKGDYYIHFAPPLQKVLQRAWVDYPIASSAGTPENMDWLITHPRSVALLQGDVVGVLLKEPKYAGKIEAIRSDIGNETLLGIMSQKAFERSQGSWAALARRAQRVRFVTSSEQSGPARTFKQLQAMDPDGLGKADIVYAKDMDAAIDIVAKGEADVAFMVQFPNTSNPRFQKVREHKLHVVPVITIAMKGLEIPGVGPAYSLCEGVETPNDGTISTACTPIVIATGTNNGDPEMAKTIKDASRDAFTPPETGFARFWRQLKVGASGAWEAAASNADRLAKKLADQM